MSKNYAPCFNRIDLHLQCIIFIFFNLLSLESYSTTCSSVINILDLKDQFSCCQKTFWIINSCIQGNYIVNNNSLLYIMAFRLISNNNHIFGRAIWNKLPKCIFQNFEISQVKQGQFQNFQKSGG